MEKNMHNYPPPPAYDQSQGQQQPPYPTQQPLMHQMPQQQQHVYLAQQQMPQQHPQAAVVIVAGPNVGPEPSRVVCPSCLANIVTRVDYEASSRTHLMALLLCFIGCWPCAALPYCLDSCRNANHYCPRCNAFIGAYRSQGL